MTWVCTHNYFYYDFTDKEAETERVCHIRDVIPLESGDLTQESSRKTSTSASLTILKPLTVWITTKCGKFIKELGIPDHLTCLLRNLYAGQEVTVRTGHATMDWFKIGKGVC